MRTTVGTPQPRRHVAHLGRHTRAPLAPLVCECPTYRTTDTRAQTQPCKHVHAPAQLWYCLLFSAVRCCYSRIAARRTLSSVGPQRCTQRHSRPLARGCLLLTHGSRGPEVTAGPKPVRAHLARRGARKPFCRRPRGREKPGRQPLSPTGQPLTLACLHARTWTGPPLWLCAQLALRNARSHWAIFFTAGTHASPRLPHAGWRAETCRLLRRTMPALHC